MNRHFGSWLCYRHGIGGCALGWATAIERRHPQVEKALAVFFKFVDEYRRLRLTPICTVRLGRKRQPTGKRVRYGLDGLMEKPCRVDVIRYRPEPLHFLRFHYPDRVEDDDILKTGTGDYATTVRFAKEWVRDELQVEFRVWRAYAGTRK
jgi:hypothetical protein